MRYGFAIDQRTCIGCHACTVACKTEHQVPVGQFRTWVKYVDSGTYPDAERSFGVMRCNHCTDAPCVAICPTGALFTREDGIVDFDSDRCIGCKSCMQACPYDALYLDEDTHTAAKCNFCAHRIDEGLEPACVVVCPTESIWVGDLSDPDSAISRFLDTTEHTVRAPEQNTGPNVFYVAANPSVLDPLAAPPDETYLWADVDPHRREVGPDLSAAAAAAGRTDPSGARTTLNTAHPRPWGWRVSTYLWTKSVAAGALMSVVLVLLAGLLPGDPDTVSGLRPTDPGTLAEIVAPLLALVFVSVTGVLLVADLKRPERFWYLFAKPNPRSWLVWGALALSAYSAISFGWLVAGLAGAGSVLDALRIPAFLAGGLTAGYTGFLFRQAEGRDLWQSPLLFWHLLVQALMAGAGALLVALPWTAQPEAAAHMLGWVFVLATVAHLVMLAAEYGRRHGTKNASVAAYLVVRGRYRATFWLSVAAAALGALLAALGGTELPVLGLLGGLLGNGALIGYESVFVRAGQDPPLS